MSLHHLLRGLSGRRWERVRRMVFERDGWRCAMCGRAARLECDHVRPLHRGGDPWDTSNLQALCRDCHQRKSAAERGTRRQDPVLRRLLDELMEGSAGNSPDRR